MKELKFIHITKCAGTYIENIGIKHGYKWGRFHKEYGLNTHCSEPWHNYIIPDSIKNKYDWFMIIRNPYHRIISEFYCKWGFGGYKRIKNHTIQSMNDFLKKQIHNRDKLSQGGGHYTEQYKYIEHNPNSTIIHYENFVEELSSLFKKYNIHIPLEFKIEPKIKKQTFTINDFDSELIELINKVYSKDFELGGYTKIYPKIYPSQSVILKQDIPTKKDTTKRNLFIYWEGEEF